MDGRSRCRCVPRERVCERRKWRLTIDDAPAATQKSPAPCAAPSSPPPAFSSPSRASRSKEIDNCSPDPLGESGHQYHLAVAGGSVRIQNPPRCRNLTDPGSLPLPVLTASKCNVRFLSHYQSNERG